MYLALKLAVRAGLALAVTLAVVTVAVELTGAAAQAPPSPPPLAASRAPAVGRLSIVPERVGGQSASVLVGAQWRVRGVVVPYVPGQRATVRFYRGHRRLKVRRVAIRPSRTGHSGYFLVAFRSSRPGRVTIRASHRATPELDTLVARPRSVRIVAPSAAPGMRGPAVRLLQLRLAAKRYAVSVSGGYDDRTARAVMAFRKLTGMERAPTADAAVFRRLARGAGAFTVRHPEHGRHIEASLTKQVLALIDPGGRVGRIYPMSSGAPATPTVLGAFRVYLKAAGTNAKGMFMSSFFTGNYAIHGFPSVPPFPASHGCLRIPMADAVSVFNWIRHGTLVDVYS